MTRQCLLYRHYDEQDRLLYVGVTANPLVRLAAHSAVAAWFLDIARSTYEKFPDRKSAEAAEAAAILAEKPIHNIVAARGGRGPGPRGPRLPNDGPFPAWLRDQRMSQAQAANAIGVSHSHMSAIIKRQKIPSVQIAIAIEKLTEGAVPASAWTPTP